MSPGIQALAPRVVANNAWKFVRAADDGCAMSGTVLGGQASLPFK